MKKQAIIIGLMVLGLATTVSAQKAYVYNDEMITKSSSDDDEKVVHKGLNTINIYAGPSLIKTAFTALTPSDADGVAFKGATSFGLVYEHLLGEKFGLGAEFGYRNMTMNFTERGPNGIIYSDSWKLQVYRIMLRCNWHWVRTKRFDMYGFLSVGYRGGTNTLSTNNPDYTGKLTYSPIPAGVKPGLGFRYFFIKNVGINLELAIGTPIICGGLSFAF